MKDNFITKEKSQVLYGIGICLMVYHHLFAFPERINSSYIMLLDFGFLHVGTMLSYFGKICVALYAFLSGYALTLRIDESSSIKNIFLNILKRLKKFYSTYFIIIAIFVPLGLFLGKINFNFIELIKNMSGISSSYNAEWWYVKQYVLMLLCYPFIIKFINIIDKNRMKYGLYIILYICSTIFIYYSQNVFYSYLLCFFTGILVCYEKIFIKINKLRINPFIALLLLAFVFLVRTLFLYSNFYDYLIIVPFIYGLLKLSDLSIFMLTLNKILKFIGKYSKYIYYTHTFFIYYYFQNLIYISKFSIVIFMWTLSICIAVAMILMYIDKNIVFIRKR